MTYIPPWIKFFFFKMYFIHKTSFSLQLPLELMISWLCSHLCKAIFDVTTKWTTVFMWTWFVVQRIRTWALQNMTSAATRLLLWNFAAFNSVNVYYVYYKWKVCQFRYTCTWTKFNSSIIILKKYQGHLLRVNFP